jgi:TRAP-type C4-dicarboxylate transport system permease small subunit
MIIDNFSFVLGKTLKIIIFSSYCIVTFCIVVLTFLTTADVITRTFFGEGIKGVTEISGYILVLIGFLAVIVTQSYRQHTSVTFMIDRFPPNIKAFVQKLNTIILILISSLFVYAGTKKALTSFYADESEWFGAFISPVWFFRFVVPIAFSFMLIQYLVDILPKSKK